jgi:cation:H+ antiporter
MAELIAIPIAILMVIAGLIGVIVGGNWVVDGAITFARLFGASEALIGLTLVAIGSSFPELVVSVVASWRKNPGISVGNIVGSNIFDFLGILGITTIFRPIPFTFGLTSDILVTLSAAILLFLTMFVGRRYTLSRAKGAIFVLTYLIYLGFVLARG